MPTVPAGNLPYTGVPTAEPQVGGPSNFQNIRATADEFGAIGGQELEKLGLQTGRAADQLAATQTFLSTVEADKAGNEYRDYENKVLYGDPAKGDTGFYGLKGEDAVKAFPGIRDSLSQARNNLRARLGNQIAVLKFDEETRRQNAITMSQVGRHFVAETQEYGKAEAVAKQKNGLTAAAQAIARDDNAGWEQGVGDAMRGAMEELQRTGQANNPAIVDAKLQQIRGEAVKVKAESIAQKNPLAAAEFIRNNIDAMTGDEGNQLLARYRSRAQSLQSDIDNGFAAPPPSRGQTDKYDGANFTKGNSGAVLAKYATGNAVLGGPSSVEGVHPEFARRIDTMVQAMPPEIQEKFNIISGFRSQARQEQVNPSVKNSHHTQGMAVDTTEDPDVIAWINQNGAKFGVGYTLNYMPNEQNHLEPIEGGQRVPLEEAASWAQFNRGGALASAPDKVDNWETRHNNFGGIRKAGMTAGANAGGFESYATPQEGVRAIVDKLHRWSTEGVATAMNPEGGPLQSLRQIISVWAPPTENDTAALIARASKLTGFGPDDRLDLNNPTVMAKVTEAMIRNEHGGKLPVSPTIIANESGQAPGLSPARETAQRTNQGLVQLASNDPDQLIPNPIKPLPKIDRALPPLEGVEQPDATVPGMAEQLDKLMKNIPPDEVERWNAGVKRARQVLNQKYQEQQRALRLHNEQVKAQSEATQDQYMQRMAKGEQIPISQVLGDSRMTPEHRREMTRFVERENKQDPAALVSKRNTVNLLDNIWNGKITEETPLKEAYIQGAVTYQDFEKVRKEFRDQRSEGGETLKEQKRELMGAVTNRILGPYAVDRESEALDEVAAAKEGRPSAKMRVYNFISDLNEKIAQYQKDGKNPRELFNPKNQDFVGSLENLKRFEPPFRAKLETGKVTATKTPSEMTNQELVDFAKRATNDADYALAIAEGVKRGMIAQPAPPPIPGPQAPQAPVAR